MTDLRDARSPTSPMKHILVARRRESALLLLTIVVVALLVSLLANGLFAQFYPSQPGLFIKVVSGALVVSIAILYAFVLARREVGFEAATLVYVFDRTVPAFVDIPRGFPSVRMRVHFQMLSPERRAELAKGDSSKQFFTSELFRFANEATEASLLSLLFGLQRHALQISLRRMKHGDLPKTLRKNECLGRGHHKDEYYYLPEWANFVDYKHRDWGILVETSFGSVTVDWDIVWGNSAIHTEAYLAATGQLKGLDTHEIAAEVFLRYDCRFMRLHSRELKEYVSWIGLLTQELRQLDWRATETHLTFEILQALAVKIDAQQPKGP